ncbi:MAG: bifunctional folylpolyglutamate synthase/dihydrofolate synthase [Angustibacter sp.]
MTDDEERSRITEVLRELALRPNEAAISPSLAEITRLLDLMGNPQSTLPIIQIAGTNGKTSTARMIDSLLRELGLRTGLFTSPHLHDVRERILINGELISPGKFAEAWDDVAPYLAMVDGELTPINEFQVLTAMAFAAFAEAPVDVGVLEVGMGGTWDATNVAHAQVAVVTPIGLDHQQFLGETIAEIAGEKAGIMKSGATAIIARQSLAAAEVLVARAQAVSADVVLAGEQIGILSRELAVGGQLLTIRGMAAEYPDLLLPLHGEHQAENLVLAIAAVEAFIGGGEEPLDLAAVQGAVAQMSSPGRLEVVRSSPTVLVDAAHNPAGAQSLATAIGAAFTFSRLIGVIGVLGDKDAEGILAALEPVLDQIVLTRSDSPRAVHPEDLQAIAEDIYGPDRVLVQPSLPRALALAVDLAEADGDLGGAVLATGSVTVAGQVRGLLRAPMAD